MRCRLGATRPKTLSIRSNFSIRIPPEAPTRPTSVIPQGGPTRWVGRLQVAVVGGCLLRAVGCRPMRTLTSSDTDTGATA